MSGIPPTARRKLTDGFMIRADWESILTAHAPPLKMYLLMTLWRALSLIPVIITLPYVEHAAEQKMSRIQEKNYCRCRAGAWYFHCFDSYVEVVFGIFLAHPFFDAKWRTISYVWVLRASNVISQHHGNISQTSHNLLTFQTYNDLPCQRYEPESTFG